MTGGLNIQPDGPIPKAKGNYNNDQPMSDLLNDKLAQICPDPIIGVDRKGIINLFNPAAEQLLEYTHAEVVGRVNIVDLYHPPEAARQIKRLIHSPEHGRKGQLQGHESALITKSGQVIPIKLSASLLEEDGKEIGSLGFFQDLTQHKALEASLKQLAITDDLTGLYNQRHFHNVLSLELDRCKRYSRALCMICIDIDNFKLINDTLGHLEGDNILRFIGGMISQLLRHSDYGFRYGGDEFMLVLPETALKDAESLGHRLIASFDQERPPSLLEHPELRPLVSLSMGIAELTPGESDQSFVKRTDMAMYRAKRHTGSCIFFAED